VVPIDESQEAKDAADLAVAMALGWVGGERECLSRMRYLDRKADGKNAFLCRDDPTVCRPHL
jgi:hypothetical protein